MKLKQTGLLLLIFCVTFFNASAQKFNGNSWKDHLQKDLIPFWTTPEALGNPAGNFPTFRAGNGLVVNSDYLKNHQVEGWIIEQSDSLRKQFIRTISRQTYFYCVAFHITGNDTLLSHAKSGIDYLRHFVRPSGMVYPVKLYTQNSSTPVSETDSLHVTTQDLAAVLYSVSFYYYLTRDEQILSEILKVKDYIFGQYTDGDGYLKWTLCSDVSCQENKTDLAAFLEQINGYLLLMAPLIDDESTKGKFIDELVFFNQIMKTPPFHNSENKMIWAKTKCRSCLNDEKYTDPLRVIGSSTHTDYGQTIRAYWCMYLSGKLLNDTATCNFAYKNATKILNNAFIPESGTWATSPFENETINWWLHAELDEGAAIFSSKDQSISDRILKKTYQFWLDHLVDKENHEVLAVVKKDSTPLPGLKTNQWKNGFHTAEHVLFAYITSGGLYNENVALYFAFRNSEKKHLVQVKPCYFGGEINQIALPKWQKETLLSKDFSKTHFKSKVTFAKITGGRSMN